MVNGSKLTKTINIILIGCLLIIVPIINIKGFIRSEVTTKFIFFSVYCLVLIVVYMSRVISLNQIKWKLSKLDYSLAVFVIYISLNRYLIQDYSNFSIRYMELLGLSFLYICFRFIPIRFFYWFLISIVLSGIIQAVYGNLQLLGIFESNHSKFNITGSFFNPGPYAGFLSSIWILSLGMYLYKSSIITYVQKHFITINNSFIQNGIPFIFKYVPLVGLFTITLVIPATQSRAAWLTIVIGALALVLTTYKTFLKKIIQLSNPKKALGIAAIIIIASASFYGIYQFKKDSANGRLLIWKVSSNIIKDYPIFGVGFDRFTAHYINYQATYFSSKSSSTEAFLAGNTQYAFNELIQVTVENGIIGLVLLLLIGFLLYTIPIASSSLGLILKSTLLGIGTFALFAYPMQILPIKLILVFLLAGIANLEPNIKTITLPNKLAIKALYKTGLVIGGIAVFFFSTSILKELTNGFKIWKEASYSYNNQFYEESITKYESVLDIFYNNSTFLEQYGQALSVNRQYNKAILFLSEAEKYGNTNVLQTTLGNCYKALGNTDKAEMAYKKAEKINPSLFYPQYLLAKLYKSTNQYNKAISIAYKLLEKKIKIPSQAIQEMKLEMRQLVVNHNKKTSGLLTKNILQ